MVPTTDTATLGAWRGNTRRLVQVWFDKHPDTRDHFIRLIDAVDITAADAEARLRTLKHQTYVARNRMWVEDFLVSERLNGKPARATKELVVRIKKTPLDTPNFAFVIQGWRNELWNIRTGDVRGQHTR